MDLISDDGSDTNKAIDKTEFGLTIGLGEIGKVAIAHTSVRNTVMSRMYHTMGTDDMDDGYDQRQGNRLKN